MGPTALLLLTSLLRSSSLQASVRVSPDRSQFFKLKSVSLSCDRDWTVTRNTSRETGTQCGVGWGTLTGSLCKISTLYSWDSGLYWCESREGQASDTVSIRVKDGGVVLQSPLLPVTEGQTVSLSCLHHTSSILPARFHRDGHVLSEQPTGHMTIQQVSVSDEGLYHCEIQGELSESSWLHVTPGKPQAPPTTTQDPPTTTPALPTSDQAPPTMTQAPPSISQAPPPTSGRPLALALLCHLVVFCPYVVSTVLMVSLFRTRTRGTGDPVVAGTAPALWPQDDDLTTVAAEYDF